MSHARREGGFSLIELAVVLVIIGLLIGGGIAALTATTEQTRRSEAKRQLEHVREALYGFAMSNGRLPCPDSSFPPDGRGDPQPGGGSSCDESGGALPWVDLGLGRRDPWGHPLHYRVDVNSPDFADPDKDQNDPAFDLGDDGDLVVQDGDGGNIVTDTPAVVVSFGPQGGQVWTGGSAFCSPAPAGFSNDELENCDDNNTFVAAEYRPPDASDGRFDDVVTWLPLPVLKSRMVDAGLLP